MEDRADQYLIVASKQGKVLWPGSALIGTTRYSASQHGWSVKTVANDGLAKTLNYLGRNHVML